MGSHIAASPAHSTETQHSMWFRPAMAMIGHHGVEMDPRKHDDAERAELADWITFHQQWRDLLHGGLVWQTQVWQTQGWQTQGRIDELLLLVIRDQSPQNRRPQPVPLPFAGRDGTCDDIPEGKAGHAAHIAPLHEAMRLRPHAVASDWLTANGLPLPPGKAETVTVFHLRKRA